MQEATIHNLEAQANKLIEPCKAQQVDIVDSSQCENELAIEIAIILEDLKKYEEMLVEKARVEHQQSIELDFEDADVVEEIPESTKDIDDTYLVDSSVISVEDVDNLNVNAIERIGPHSKHFSTLCLDDDMEIESSEPLEEPRSKEQDACILKFFVPESRDYTSHLKAKKYRILHCFIEPVRFVLPPQEHDHRA
uniref:Uncharacterized protein LOC104249417 n=1 Tax=Nicotiana sylvestris TaxID=4096 RepID=A0A1U7YQ96_NICSY|nr:PREDICTED: uncharacterized protein LOC104249417 [Nicotiana sylvestris]XP_009804142.1 PREDICTED: uncharacterized protein LOC104249417 [Nicotiana sylvestris]